MKSVLVGNGINIQFGNSAYTSKFIVSRIKYNARVGKYDEILQGKMNGDEIVQLLGDLVGIANKIKDGLYDGVKKDSDTERVYGDFRDRYKDINIGEIHDVMLEDWFFLLHMFFVTNKDLEELRQPVIQGFEQMILEGIYNEGNIQKLYKNMGKSVKRFFKGFDNIFTLNYDNNIEKLTGEIVYHLHGDFEVLTASENEKYVSGYIRKSKGQSVLILGKEHLYCNALLNYSGEEKRKVADANYKLNKVAETFKEQYMDDAKFRTDLEALKIKNNEAYEMIKTKIEHPELHMAMEYYFDKFEEIEDELYIIGMSPNNDGHIYRCIEDNLKLKKVYVYCFSKSEYNYIKNNMRSDLYEPLWINDLWKRLDCEKKKYSCGYNLKDKLVKFREIFTLLSDFKATDEEIEECINSIPEYEQRRLCRLVKENLDKRNPEHNSTDKEEFERTRASISQIAVQEGVLPPALYVITVMHFKKE